MDEWLLHLMWTATSSRTCRTKVSKARLYTLENGGKVQYLGKRKTEIPKLKGMTIVFAHVLGRAS